MAFQRLNIRAKKSFSGLYNFDNMDSCPPKSTAMYLESSPRLDLTQDAEECGLEDFGPKLERCKGKDSPGKDSPSKRKKLLGSLRSLRSLANLHSSPTKTKLPMTPRLDSTVTQQDECMTQSPSLALLNFGQSPSDELISDLKLRQRSVSGSSLEVHHSSPVTVPSSAKQANPYTIFPPATVLPSGTIPDTPGPMQRAFDRDPANNSSQRNASPTPMERYAPLTPVLTPLPGTNLSVVDFNPELIPLPPCINPPSVHLSRASPGYFDIPVDERPQMDSTDTLNGIACLKLADRDEGASSHHHSPLTDVRTDPLIGRHGTAEEMRLQYQDAKLQDSVRMLGIPQDRARVQQHAQRAKELKGNACTQGTPKHHQVLPLQSPGQGDDLQDLDRKTLCTSEDSETCNWDLSTAMAAQHSLHTHDPRQPGKASPSSVYPAAAPSKALNATSGGHDSLRNLTYIIRGDLRQAPAPENAWGRHTGLYDGTGYGPDSSGSSTPQEPDEGTQDVQSQASPAPLSVNGGRSDHKASNGPLRSANPYRETARGSPCTTHNQPNCDSLESLYHAYAYPLEDDISSCSDDSTDKGKQVPATREDKISS